MTRLAWAFLAVVTDLVSVATAQQSGWGTNQVNATMCQWQQLRAAVIRDTLYLDGGDLWWIPGLADGEYGPVSDDGNPLGVVYTLNFSTPFNTNQNISAILGTLFKAGNGGAANNIAPNYFDGAILANDDEWFSYGGLLRQTQAFAPPPGNQVLAYQAFQYGTPKPAFRPGFLQEQLPSGLTRYLAYGGAANAPSENKAYYFSGLHSPSWGPVYIVSGNESLTAINVSNTLISLDMSTQQQESWSNKTLPDFIHGRANPELVWVPVGSQGILVALGGVVDPDFVSVIEQSENPAASQAESPGFMSTIDVYDIAGDKWYQQNTTGGPGQLTRGCSVVAPAQDGSSFNIYYYGGYDGLHQTQDFNDDVWILSLPSFTWQKISTGNSTHGRAGHKCVKPYPDQMFVVGGYPPFSGDSLTCVEGSILQVFNLTSGTWMTSYDPAKWSNYGVPDVVRNKIGGDATGGATMTSPSPSWATAALGSVFATPYPTSKIATFYPYASAATTNNTRPDLNPSPTAAGSGGGNKGSSVPSFLAPLLGVILGVMFVSAVVLAILLYRRRRLLRGAGAVSEAGTDDPGSRIFSWLRGQPSEAKAPTVTTSTEDTPMSPEMESASPVTVPAIHHEMADTHIAELMDTSPRAELQDTGLTPIEIINKHSHFAPANGGSVNSSSLYYSSVAQTDHASSVSQSSGLPHGSAANDGASPASALAATSPAELRADSPSLGTAAEAAAAAATPPAPADARIVSGVSGISERDRAHLRQTSDATVSSMETAGAATAPPASPRPQPEAPPAAGVPLVPVPETETAAEPAPSPSTPGAPAGAQPSPLSPGLVSPPTPAGEGEDYLSAPQGSGAAAAAGAAGSPLRKSVFYENEDDMEGRR